jgi:hypothetical protein
VFDDLRQAQFHRLVGGEALITCQTFTTSAYAIAVDARIDNLCGTLGFAKRAIHGRSVIRHVAARI